MSIILRLTRYIVIVPIVGLILAAAAFFLFGGINLILLLVQSLIEVVTSPAAAEAAHEGTPLLVEVVEYVHTFLVGTVLLITAIGFYQLFIENVDVPEWLNVEGTDELETALIGVTVVVLAVHFMTIVFTGEDVDLLDQGLGTGAVILSLAAFLGLRSWGEKQKRLAATIHDIDTQRIDTESD